MGSTITHVANASGAPVKVFYSQEENILKKLVLTAHVQNVLTLQLNFKSEDSHVSFERIPTKSFAKFDIRGPIYISVYVVCEDDEDRVKTVVAEDKKIPNNMSFIVTKNHSFRWQKYGANIWVDEQGNNHNPCR